jgi:hypothetical protein
MSRHRNQNEVSRSFRRAGGTGLLVGCLMARICLSGAEPHIEKIEPFSTNSVLVHFDTEANRDYRLEYTDSLLCTRSNGCPTNMVPTDWALKFHWPRSPFPNHFIVADIRTNAQRCYRLKVTP